MAAEEAPEPSLIYFLTKSSGRSLTLHAANFLKIFNFILKKEFISLCIRISPCFCFLRATADAKVVLLLMERLSFADILYLDVTKSEHGVAHSRCWSRRLMHDRSSSSCCPPQSFTQLSDGDYPSTCVAMIATSEAHHPSFLLTCCLILKVSCHPYTAMVSSSEPTAFLHVPLRLYSGTS
ncbi:hypothetical protein Nepgr_029793 [Nepenthes gracilis]|uniref:Uncharacterized protein n=1 Tax=Nepenthes gracilis TaxID=150966 RepID=A0AAD3TD93_NEPGR|nr:hypothetical protein Nepgr_029793 [Nepenthes gracilis]